MRTNLLLAAYTYVRKLFQTFFVVVYIHKMGHSILVQWSCLCHVPLSFIFVLLVLHFLSTVSKPRLRRRHAVMKLLSMGWRWKPAPALWAIILGKLKACIDVFLVVISELHCSVVVFCTTCICNLCADTVLALWDQHECCYITRPCFFDNSCLTLTSDNWIGV